MYAFILRAHQKIDRQAMRGLQQLAACQSGVSFPSLRQVLHFEGRNGPDATKFKRALDEQPWHFINPFDETDMGLRKVIGDHYDSLVHALKTNNTERAAFDAAWMAHAIVDGLTPAHHYPYEAELEQLRGQDRHNRSSLKDRMLIKGATRSESIHRSFLLLGPKGLLTTHTSFEAGAYMLLLRNRPERGMPNGSDVTQLHDLGVLGYFQRQAREIAALDIYEIFRRTGWTPTLARMVRREVVPRMVKTVMLVWYAACIDAGLVKAAQS